jgi:hypothetical protein
VKAVIPKAMPSPRSSFSEGSLMSIANLPVEEVARQLTLIDFDLYKRVEAIEFHKISKGFQNAPNVQLMTDFFNRACQFFVNQILRDKTYNPANCAAYISGVIGVGQACKSWNNWNGMMIVVAALNTTSVSRLVDSWALLSKEDSKRADELTGFTRKNFRLLREGTNGSSSPAIPHFALAVRDLTGLDESPTFLMESGHVNYFKLKMISEIIWQMLRHRETGYDFEPKKRLQDWIIVSDILDEQKAYERSKSYPVNKDVGAAGLKGSRIKRRSVNL